ncbi:hydroxymethylglutaryl-CoA lyase [Cupriavidus basilensis]
MYSALTPNMKGFEAALAAGADEAVIFGAASEAFSQRNINCSVAESIARFEPVAAAAKAAGLRLRASISCALGCPYEGEIAVDKVAEVVGRMRDLGCDEIDIADTIGVGTPLRTQAVMEAAARVFPRERLAGHFHDTYGQALPNILASLQVGIRIFHASVAWALAAAPTPRVPRATGHGRPALHALHGMGIRTGIDLDQVIQAGAFISEAIGRPYGSRASARRCSNMTARPAEPACSGVLRNAYAGVCTGTSRSGETTLTLWRIRQALPHRRNPDGSIVIPIVRRHP